MFGYFRHHPSRHTHHNHHPHCDPQAHEAFWAIGRHGHRRHGGFGFGPQRWSDDAEFGGPGRKLGSADLQLLILALLDEQPRHGYELIKALEERSGGYYVPSPGVIYPALSYLEEVGHAEVQPEGAKKLYSLTQAGREHLERNRSLAQAMLQQLQRAGERMAQMREAMQGSADDFGFGARHERREALHAAMHDLRAALRDRLGRGREADDAEFQRVLTLLRQAADDIRQR